jgi:hypothetical protein
MIAELEGDFIDVADGNSAKVNDGRTDGHDRPVGIPNNCQRDAKYARQCKHRPKRISKHVGSSDLLTTNA